MPKGPQGQKRPADVVGGAVLVAKIATGEAEETTPVNAEKRRAGLAGGKARADSLPAEKRLEIARLANSSRRR